MRYFLILALVFGTSNGFSEELNADQLEGLSECDYFKYTECTGAGLTVGSCVKNKYDGFSKACGKVHADKFIYSREMFKPIVNKKKGKASCEAVQAKLCSGNGLSLNQCAGKYNKELSAACEKDFMKGIGATKELDKCFDLRKRFCSKEVDPDCDAKFQAQAPSICKSEIKLSDKKEKGGGPSEKALVGDCMKTMTDTCKLDEEEMMKDGANVQEIVRKYQLCVKRSLKKKTGKCGSHFPDVEKMKKEYPPK